MAILDIRLLGDEVLRVPAAPVEAFDEELQGFVEHMFETMYHAEGIGLAAPQVGVSKRITVLDIRASDENGPQPVALINPSVTFPDDETERATEGCLSIPGFDEVVERAWRVRVDAVDPTGTPLQLEAEGLFARALQHEIDHLDGILFIDRISPLKRRMLLKKWRKAQEEG